MFVTIEITKMRGWMTPSQVIYFTPPLSSTFAVQSAQEMGLKSFPAALWHQSLKLLIPHRELNLRF